jgi:hypothetical protein
MRNLLVFTSLTLDGGMQAPGRSDEDPRSGVAHSGWAQPYNHPDHGQGGRVQDSSQAKTCWCWA